MALTTDMQRVGLDGLRHFAGPKDGGGTNDNLARPLQHPLLPRNLRKIIKRNVDDADLLLY